MPCIARPRAWVSTAGMFSHHARSASDQRRLPPPHAAGDPGLASTRLPAPRRHAFSRRPDPHEYWRSSPPPAGPNRRLRAFRAAMPRTCCAIGPIGVHLRPAALRTARRADAPARAATAQVARDIQRQIGFRDVRFVTSSLSSLRSSCRSFTRALAMCERTVALEQFKLRGHFLGRQILPHRAAAAPCVRDRSGRRGRLPDAPCAPTRSSSLLGTLVARA